MNLIIERTEPGPYDWHDFNRVGEAVRYIAAELKDLGYIPQVSPKLNWTRDDIQRIEQMDEYLENVRNLRAVLPISEKLPAVPTTIRFLTWQGANNIERVLFEIEEALNRMRAAWFYSGEVYSGEV